MREIRTSGSTRGGAPSGPLLLYRLGKTLVLLPCDRRASPLFSTLVQFIKSVPKSQSERPGWSHPVQSGESPEAPLSRGRKQAAASGVG